MAQKFNELRGKMSPEAQARSTARTESMLDLNFQDLEDKWNLKSLINPIECHSGWFGLLKQFFEELSPKQRSKDVHQIKEKYGTLRIYGSPEVETIAKKYEALSAQTCEMTGEPGKLHKRAVGIKHSRAVRLRC